MKCLSEFLGFLSAQCTLRRTIDLLNDKNRAASEMSIAASIFCLMIDASKKVSLYCYRNDSNLSCVWMALQEPIEMFEVRIFY